MKKEILIKKGLATAGSIGAFHVITTLASAAAPAGSGLLVKLATFAGKMALGYMVSDKVYDFTYEKVDKTIEDIKQNLVAEDQQRREE